MNVFGTSPQAYIGAHLVELLKAWGHAITGCNLGLFEGNKVVGLPALKHRHDRLGAA